MRDLVYAAGDDLKLAQYGIIYIDEIDKIASAAHTWGGPDVSRTGVQRALLKPMEETEVDLKVAHDPVSQIQAIEHYRRAGKKESAPSIPVTSSLLSAAPSTAWIRFSRSASVRKRSVSMAR